MATSVKIVDTLEDENGASAAGNGGGSGSGAAGGQNVIYSVEVIGSVSDAKYHNVRLACDTCAGKAAKLAAQAVATGGNAGDVTRLEVAATPMVPVDYDVFLTKAKQTYGGSAYAHKGSPLVLVNGAYFGGFRKTMVWLSGLFGYSEVRPPFLYDAIAKTETKKLLSETGFDYATLEISVDGGDPQPLLFELYTAAVPFTCENFFKLCGETKKKEKGKKGPRRRAAGASTSGAADDDGGDGNGDGDGDDGPAYTYVGSLIHRVVPGGWIQGGDVLDGAGDGSVGASGETFGDESFAISHTALGTLGMANDGPHSNGSQWYVTLRPDMTWMDRRFVAFGRLIDGLDTLREIEGLEAENQRPVVDVAVVGAGRYSL